MSAEFVLTLLFLLVTLVAFVIKSLLPKTEIITEKDNYGRNKEPKEVTHGGRIVASIVQYIALGIAVVFLFFACAYTVPVRNVGIVTSFNAPTGDTTGNGLKFVYPWQQVKDFDASRQTESHLGDWNHGCTVVRIGSLATACVENQFSWQVRANQAPELYKIYKGDFHNLQTNLVDLEARNAINSVFSTYNPLQQVDLKTGQTTFDGTALGKKFLDELTIRLNPFGIDIYNVSVPLVHHDTTTEANIKQFQDVVLQARILDQKKLNADKEKAVSNALIQVLNPAYIQNKCIEYSKDMGFAPGLCMMNSGIVNVPTTK